MLRSSALLCLSLFAGCGVAESRVMQDFAAGELAAVAEFAWHEATAGPAENQALALNVLALCELLQGEVEAAWQHFGVAAQLMGNWSPSSRTYQGDPYERAMNAYYLGLCYLWRGEPEPARASFQRGILQDAGSGDAKYQADFALLSWLAGRMSLLLGLPGDAEGSFAEARQAHEFALQNGSRGERSNAVLDAPAAGNLLLLVECGLGPEKFADEQDPQLVRFRPRAHPAVRAQVFVDGATAGLAQLLTDVDYQARTRGGTEVYGIQATWRADLRHWRTLPSSVQALALDVEPGEHALRIEFRDSEDNVLAEMTQHWSVHVPVASESWYIFRSLPGLDLRSMITP